MGAIVFLHEMMLMKFQCVCPMWIFFPRIKLFAVMLQLLLLSTKILLLLVTRQEIKT